jgi:hypothetical protein
MKKLILTLAIILYPFLAFGADVTMTWDVSPGATGYKVQMSTDKGVTWGVTRDAGNVTSYTWLGAPNTGLLLFRATAYNAANEAIRSDAGVWYCGDWVVPGKPKGVGVE